MSAAAPTASPCFPSGSALGELPVGAVIAYAGTIANANIEIFGWMLCDGRMLESARYPELFAALGQMYGGSDKLFQLPDYRSWNTLAPETDAKGIGINYLIKFTYGLSPGRSD